MLPQVSYDQLGVPLHHNDTRYEVMEEIGQEEEATIWVAYDHELEEYVTIKRIPRGPNVNRYVEREVLNRQTLFHPHITRMREVAVTEQSLDIVLDFSAGRNLAFYADQFAPLSERHARHFFQQIIIAVDFCHKRATCVRDVRLENLALNMQLDIVKLQSFRLSKNFTEQSKARSKVGAYAYAAPEVLLSDGRSEYDAHAVDVWGSGIYPYDDDITGHDNTVSRIIAGNLVIPQYRIDRYSNKDVLSRDCLNLLHRLLEYNPKDRITVREILRHPWFLQNLPKGALEMNAGVDPLDDKLHCANKQLHKKSFIKRLLAYGAQPMKKSFRP